MTTLGVVRDELLRIYDTRGNLTPALVVEEAAAVTSPLHGEFEWDDRKAGHEYRLRQAGGLIRSVRVKVTRQDDSGAINDYKVREWTAAFTAEVPGLEPGSYLPTAELDSKARIVLLQRMQRELQSMKHRYSAYAEFWAQLEALVEENQAKAS